MEKYRNGIVVGILAGGINCLFLLFASDIEVPVYVSTILTWFVIGLFISATSFKAAGSLKGILVSLLISLPSFVYTISSTIFGTIWNILTTIIVGAIIGSVLEKKNK